MDTPKTTFESILPSANSSMQNLWKRTLIHSSIVAIEIKPVIQSKLVSQHNSERDDIKHHAWNNNTRTCPEAFKLVHWRTKKVPKIRMSN